MRSENGISYNPKDVYPLAALEREIVRAALKGADLVFGHDESRDGRPVLFFGRETLEEIAADRQSRPCNVFRISYDSRTDQLEYLAAAVEALKGSCCYEASGPCPPVVIERAPDGTIEVTTTDADPYLAEERARQNAELQTALDTPRGRGSPRPVLFQLDDREAAAMAIWKLLLPGLRQNGIPIFPTDLDEARPWVVPTAVARQLLQPVIGKTVVRLFRVPTWARGYWTVGIGSHEHKFYESRTLKDQALTEGT
jgi:hypothetical protein